MGRANTSQRNSSLLSDLTGFRAALLDIDGTLVDSNGAHAIAWQQALRSRGIEKSLREIRPLIGMGGDKLLPALTGIEEDSPEGKMIAHLRKEIFKHSLPQLRPFPGAREMCIALKEAGLKLVVATSASGEEAGPLLDIAGVTDLMDDRTSKDDADASKPDPDILEASLKKAGLRSTQSGQALMIGDTRYDIAAGAKAGIPVVAFRCGGSEDKALKGAVAIFDGPADFLAFVRAPGVVRDPKKAA